MAKQRIRIMLEIEAEDVVPGYGDLRNAIHYTLADALGEFRHSRGLDPDEVRGYVERRYEGQSDVYRVAKVAEVLARVKLAEALRVAINEPQAIEVRP